VGDLLKADNSLALTKAIRSLDSPTQTLYGVNVFPEYAARNLRSLIWELRSVVPENERAELDKAYSAAVNFGVQVLLSSEVLQKEDLRTYIPRDKLLERAGAGDPDAIRQMKLSQISNMGSTFLETSIPESMDLKRWGEPFTKHCIPLIQITFITGEEAERELRRRGQEVTTQSLVEEMERLSSERGKCRGK